MAEVVRARRPVVVDDGAAAPGPPAPLRPIGSPDRTLPLPTLKEAAANFFFPFRADTWLADLVLFYRQLATLIKAGVPIAESLSSLEVRARGYRMRDALTDARRTVEGGVRFSDAMERHDMLFGRLQVEMVRAAEQGGMLEEMLSRIADHLERELELRRFLSRQTMYPKTVFVIAVFVLPVIFSLIFGGNVAAAILNPLIEAVELAVFTAMVFSVGRMALSRSIDLRRTYERLKWSLPGVGKLARNYAAMRFAWALGALYGGGFSLSTALRIAGQSSGSQTVRDIAEEAAQETESGLPASVSLRRSGLFPANSLQLLETGERTGEIDGMMAKLAEYLQDETDTKAHQAAYVFSLIFYLIVAMYVTGLVQMGGGWIVQTVRQALGAS